MTITHRLKQSAPIKMVVVALVLISIVVTALLLQVFMNSLLEREATLAGQRWATNVEASLDDLDQILAGKTGSVKTADTLNHISSAGQVYRYEFTNHDGDITYSMGSYALASRKQTHDDSVSKSHDGHSTHMSDADSHEVTAHVDAEGGTHPVSAHDPHEGHSVRIKYGDGTMHPRHFAKVVHPVSKNGIHLGTVTIYMDQTETQALLRDTMLLLFMVLVGMTIIGFSLPAIFYLRGRTASNKAREEVQFHARYDAMTRLLNRRSFIKNVDQVLGETDKENLNHALHFIDVDNFKAINDTYGHDTGDELLRQVSKKLRTEISSKHIVARIGGDEFALFQKDVGTDENVKTFAAKLQEVFSTPFLLNGRDVTTSASIGTAISLRDGATCKGLMKSADFALYAVKAAGRNGQLIFEPGMKRAQDERIEMEFSLRTAREDGNFELHFQPLFISNSTELAGFEALIRMNGKDGNLIPPNDFIPVAEEMGLMEDIGRWVIQEATKVAANWPKHLALAVNLSITQFESGKLVGFVANALKESGLEPGRLELEITEGLILKNTEWNIAQLHELKELGTSIVMDDFGTGYSSLGYLWRFPFDKIKIDRSFLQGFEGDVEKVREIIQTIIALGHSLDMMVTAEGVETEDQMVMLRELDCDHLQGFYLGRPFPTEQIAPFLMKDLHEKVKLKTLAAAKAKSA